MGAIDCRNRNPDARNPKPQTLAGARTANLPHGLSTAAARAGVVAVSRGVAANRGDAGLTELSEDTWTHAAARSNASQKVKSPVITTLPLVS
jgi:hypothetical protein